MVYLPYNTLGDAVQRSRELWTAILGRKKCPQDVTEFIYGWQNVAVVGPCIVVPERDKWLDSFSLQEQLTAEEIGALGIAGYGAGYAAGY